MDSVGVYEAKTHLPRLLDRVEKGEAIQITRHGVAIATLVPAVPARTTPVRDVVAAMRQFRKGRRTGGGSIRSMIEEGRK